MTNQIQVRTRTPAPITPAPEHTPIYDMGSYLKRQRKIKIKRIIKNTAETGMYFCASALTFSMLLWEV